MSTPIFEALSPLDGRYRAHLEDLVPLVSEEGLMRSRVRVEAAWLLHLAAQPELGLALPEAVQALLEQLSRGHAKVDVARIKAIESTTKHDVKAVEYYLRERLTVAGARPEALAWIHFACTSEDINNCAYALLLRDAREQVLLPQMDALLADLRAKAARYGKLPMLARTHGQTASPTTLGKEIAVFGHRLARQRQQLAGLQLEAKMNGAVGNYNAHYAAFPMIDWPQLSLDFLEFRLGLKQNPLTTQIENHDTLVEYTDIVRRFNVIALGLCRDMWSYIAWGYFSQQSKAGEIGSSTMPHKINPIDFENAEGNLGLAVALAQHFSEKLPISRWQRDLSDSTVLRHLGVLLAHSSLAYQALGRGLAKVQAAPELMRRDLDEAWEVLAEPIQTLLRRYGVMDAYERLKEATRGQRVTAADLHALIDRSAELPLEVKAQLKAMRPADYVGLAPELAAIFAATREV